MISLQSNSLARSGTCSVVEVDRGRLEYIRRGKCWIRLSSCDTHGIVLIRGRVKGG